MAEDAKDREIAELKQQLARERYEREVSAPVRAALGPDAPVEGLRVSEPADSVSASDAEQRHSQWHEDRAGLRTRVPDPPPEPAPESEPGPRPRRYRPTGGLSQLHPSVPVRDRRANVAPGVSPTPRRAARRESGD